MKTGHVLAAAAIAGGLGLLASLSVDRSWLARTGVGQDYLLRAPDASAPVPVARVGDRLPAISLPGLDGQPRDLHAIAPGRPLLVNVWASWCGPCIKEMPLLDRFARSQAPNGIEVVGIALDDAAAVRAFLARTPVRYPVLVETPGTADAGVRLGNPRGVLPYSVLVARDGRILRQWVGPLEAPDLDDWARDVDTLQTRD
ncbi:TlpA family protein disulfide reductase [Lysobacter humi (ex Lee et al. 2017)]